MSFQRVRISTGFLLLSVLPWLISACANIIPPQGGPEDETPPKLVQEESTPNLQVNFRKQPIELTFDEWVVLKEPFQQVVISPPLQQPFELRIKGHTVIFEFGEEEQLRPDATYTINFGAAVQDLTEGNPAEDLRFVFATGNRLDSLRLSGTLVNALTGLPVEKALFMLYENLADTVVRKERPFYFGRTDTSGRFEIRNIKPGLFRGFALADGNANYKYDQESEAIGFPDSLITLSDSLPAPNIAIRLFEEEKKLRLVEALTNTFGVVKLQFNRRPEKIGFRSPEFPNLYPDYDGDTLRLWYANPPAAGWSIALQKDTSWRDTARIPSREREREAFLRTARLRMAAPPSSRLAPGQSQRIRFTQPVAAFDSTRFRLLEDTLPQPIRPVVVIDTPSQRDLVINYPWKEGANYQLRLLPGAVTDIFGLSNRDTISAKFTAEPRKSFGAVALSVSGLDTLRAYVIQITSKDGNKVIVERQVTRRPEFQETFSLVPPGDYMLRIITDLNSNGRWDTGNYDLKRQPEPIFLKLMEEVRANWDVEVKADLE